ncbi:two-component system, OmpR family, sensor histidine kinase KdpD [Sinomicrobium oceani]|uniref:histidine kinase n=1 Tax=Sinomicrobium oceani TaxID=1150368 RepID=A0A1K1RJR5_9FLAO|nr:ATP-binding protein [Sinomicrobium oceani]SFW71942.1 two-component system, OmpR family, sensor histidine kinase KdpD [Sinomicrobium oceani]
MFDLLRTRKYPAVRQYAISLSLVVLTACIAFLSVDYTGYRVVALVLLLLVSVLAILFDIFPVMVTALLSALIWNYFFIPPTFTFHIGTPEDALMFLMYFVIAFINAVMTFKIREYERKARDEEEKEKSIRLYNTLLNSLSHELRTPISAIIGAIDTIKDSANLSEVNRKELYSEVEIAATRLNRQVENLLSMSRLEAGFLKPKPDWCDINELIFKVIQSIREYAAVHRLVFEPEEDLPLFRTDSGFMVQIFHNILHNAIQHTPADTVITITAVHAGNGCRISVSDNGPGFPEDKIDLVFDKFYRLPHSATGGTGLGLSIAKGFTEALDGQLKLENCAGGGARFIVEIPSETSPVNTLENE